MARNEQALTRHEINPFRWMHDMMQSMAMPTFFGPTPERTFAPAFDVKESKDSFQFKADLPGIKEADVDVKITGNRLAITGKRDAEHEDKHDTYYTYERAFGTFQRTFVLPEDVDTEHVHAELKDGVLTVALPKRPNGLTKTVAIKSGDKTKS